MKNIEITYEAAIQESKGYFEQGEAAYVLPISNDLADVILSRSAAGGQNSMIENALYWVEMLRAANTSGAASRTSERQSEEVIP